MGQILLRALCIVLLAGCAGKLDYYRPTTNYSASASTKVIKKPRDDVWAQAVPELGKRFFVINNLDKSSGLINLSYNGDPERYLDCGQINSYVKNAAGERTYNFPASRAQMQYEEMNINGAGLVRWDRSMSLDGRINVIFEAMSAGETKVTVNTRYVVQRTNRAYSPTGQLLGSNTSTINLNTGGSAAFPANSKGAATECVPTGALEAEVLSAF